MVFSLRAPATLVCLWLASSCGGASTADALIGPEGGVVSHDDGVTLTVPPGALLTTRQIVIRPSSEDLSSGGYKQVGSAYLFEPRDLEFKIPAELTFSGDASKPVVLLKPDKRVIAYSGADDRAVGYIGSLGLAALAEGGDPVATVDEPKLSRTPAEVDLNAAFVDVATLKVTPDGSTALDLGFTAYAPAGMSATQLNGEGTAYCGFKLGMINGASITGGCSSGLTTATIGLSAPQAIAEVVPFLIGTVAEPVIVEVQVGSGDLAVSAGYFAFRSSPCYRVSCSGHGACDQTSGAAVCVCDPGYAPSEVELGCDCVPQCDDRQCGGDSCGGSCGNCDNNTHTCNNESGQCDPLPPPEPMTSEPMTDPGTSTTSDDTTTTSDDTTTTSDDTTTTGESSGESGSSSTG